jgi:hypothetical protein
MVAGVALTADPRLRTTVGLLCSVRRKKVMHDFYPTLALVTTDEPLPLLLIIYRWLYHLRFVLVSSSSLTMSVVNVLTNERLLFIYNHVNNKYCHAGRGVKNKSRRYNYLYNHLGR